MPIIHFLVSFSALCDHEQKLLYSACPRTLSKTLNILHASSCQLTLLRASGFWLSRHWHERAGRRNKIQLRPPNTHKNTSKKSPPRKQHCQRKTPPLKSHVASTTIAGNFSTTAACAQSTAPATQSPLREPFQATAL